MERRSPPDRLSANRHEGTTIEDVMKKLIFATVLAIAAAAPLAASAQDQVIIRHSYSDDNGDYRWRHRHHDRDRGIRFGLTIGDNGWHNGWRHHRHYRRDCETRWVHRWRHHHRVVERITVCDRY
jgi:Ni/Co efflux regulator RcnB